MSLFKRQIRPLLATALLIGLIAATASARDDPESCCRYVGDINHDGSVADITDLVYLVTYMYQDGPCDAMCEDVGIRNCMRWECYPSFPEADINGDGHGIPLIDDLIWFVCGVFGDGPPPVGWIDRYTPACER
jgi:hypothetical protein